MKKLMLVFTVVLSGHSFAAEMGAEAVEMYQLMSHRQVKECLAKLPRSLRTVKIEKDVMRCPGCNTYRIIGKYIEIDTPRNEIVTVTLKGKGAMNNVNQMIQTYACSISEK